jgi:peptide chain release factor 2
MLDGLGTRLDDISTYLEMYREAGEDSLLRDAEGELAPLDEAVLKAELGIFMTGEFDAASAILTIHPGAGGTESCDWAGMLHRMFTRWAEREGYKVSALEYQPADAGIKSATMLVEGPYAYTPTAT